MKILTISARYPPHHSGGYEIRMKNIIDELALRGHEILVITTKKEPSILESGKEDTYPIYRSLHGKAGKMSLIDRMTTWRIVHPLGLLLVFIREIIHDIRDLKTIDRFVNQFQPDIVYLGFILPLTRTLLPYFTETHTPTVHDDGGATLVILQENKGIWYRFVEEYQSRFKVINRLKPLFKKIIITISKHRIKPQWMWPENLTVLFRREKNKKAAEQAGIPVSDARILLSGVDEGEFSFKPRSIIQSPIKIILPARIEPRKGQLDAIRLVKELSKEGIITDLFLIGQPRKSFLPKMNDEILKMGIVNHVKLIPMIPQHELIKWYQNSDICFFPSYWKDGLSRVPLEAMACGSVVISYGNEGSSEIIQNRENGFLVNYEDYTAIVGIIKELIANPAMVEEITTEARRDIEGNFSMNHYVDQIEQILYQVIKHSPTTGIIRSKTAIGKIIR